MIASRVSWMRLPVDRSITVSAPHRVAQVSFSTSSAIEEVTAEVPMLAFTFTRNRLPMIIGSLSGWLTLAGSTARPAAISSRTTRGSTPSRIATNSISGVITPARAYASWVTGRPSPASGVPGAPHRRHVAALGDPRPAQRRQARPPGR